MCSMSRTHCIGAKMASVHYNQAGQHRQVVVRSLGGVIGHAIISRVVSQYAICINHETLNLFSKESDFQSGGGAVHEVQSI